MRTRGFTAVELVVVILVIAVLVTVVMVQVDKRRQVMLREESAANLKALWAVGQGHTPMATQRPIRGSKGWIDPSTWPKTIWPPLSTIPGKLALMPTDEMMVELQKSSNQTILISPAHPNAKQMRKDALVNLETAFTDDSYIYLGYNLPTEEAGLAFVEAYKKAVAETGKLPTGDIELKSPILVETVPADTYGPGDPLTDLPRTITALSPFSADGVKTYYVAIDGVIRFGKRIRGPVLIERPGLQRGGSNVLWGDRTVEFIPYPGKWPMTEKFIKALESLNELKDPHDDPPKK